MRMAGLGCLDIFEESYFKIPAMSKNKSFWRFWRDSIPMGNCLGISLQKRKNKKSGLTSSACSTHDPH